ncbi:MAG: DmsC/YnfH family molybdoenzyme membrane anchor subunit [Candidatus Thorarchaeota archaeon]
MLGTKVKPYEFMIFPTAQKYWIERKGILLWMGLFFVEFGASLFLVSTFFNCLWGQVAGWLVTAALGGGPHFLFLGHPFRIYRALKRPQGSWISRGLLIISLFQLFGFIHLVLSFFSAPAFWLLVTADIFAVATIAYGGYEIADVKPIRTWNSSFMPVQMFARNFFVAFAVMLAVYMLLGTETIAHGYHVKKWLNIIILINVGLFLSYLTSLAFDEGKHRYALQMMLKGDLKGIFWTLGIVGGIIIPLVLVIYSLGKGAAHTDHRVLLIAVILQFIADPLLRYCSMRSGYYEGLFPVKPLEFPRAA